MPEPKMKPGKLKVVVVDDSLVVRQRLAVLIAVIPGIELAGEAGSVTEALMLIRNCKPEAVILDLHLEGGNGFDVLRQAKREVVAPVVIMLTNFPSGRARQACIEHGADFFFDKSTEFESALEVLTALESVWRKAVVTTRIEI